MKKVAWISTLNSGLFQQHYGDAVKTWGNLPGEKYMLFDGDFPNLNFITFLNYWDCIDTQKSKWFTRKIGKKALRLSYKAYAIIWALENLKNYDIVIWIDSDVSVLKSIDENLLDIGDDLWASLLFNYSPNLEFNNQGYSVESGIQIFNMTHNDIHRYKECYKDFYESGKVDFLYRPYDNWVSKEMTKQFPMKNLVYDPDVKRELEEDSLQYTRFKNYMIHYLGKGNKKNIPS